MPIAPKRPCAEPGCAALVERGQSRCAQHASEPWAGAGKSYGGAWESLRAQVLREEPNCRMCGASSITVDHIRPKARGGGDDRANLRGLCWPCARVKGAQDAAEGRRLGRKP